jgi:hypothetical protein
MAKAPPKAPPSPDATLEIEARDRRAAAKAIKGPWEMDFRECYFFASPHRSRLMDSASSTTVTRMQDAAELNTDEAFILCGDFTTEVVQAFMSPDKPWCVSGRGMDLPDGVWDQVKEQAKKNDLAIFNAMRASNLYPEVAKGFYPDLGIGTVGLWIARPHPSRPIVVSAIPLRELEINLGPYGDIDDRFAVRSTRNVHVRELVGEEIWNKINPELKKELTEKAKDRTQVVWGFWRKWDRNDDEVWEHVVMVGKNGNNLVHHVEIKGEGCCPLWIGRFNPSPDSPFALGPLIQGLPSLRQIDEAELMLQENAELSLRPPVTYPNDGFAAVEQGFESGMAYPIRPGDEKAIKNIYEAPPANPENYAYEKKLKKLQKLFYVDLPEQSGDTPPTATQWLDERARMQRRIGTPGLSFWRDLSQIFLRFKYLLEASKTIVPLTIDGRAVAMLPRNPAQAAAKLQAVAEATRTAGTLGGMFPEEFKINVDGRATMEAWLEETEVSLIKLRPLDQVQKAVDQMEQLAGARHVSDAGNAAPGPGA